MSIRSARSRAESLVDQFGIKNAPVDVDSIARNLGLPIVYLDLGEEVSGLLVTESNSSCIAVQENDSRTRQRFTVAHEIAHYVLRHQFQPGENVHVDRGNFISQRGPRSSTGTDLKEIEANQFAASLLMPARLVNDYVRKLGVRELLDFHVSDMARAFNVSEQAMTIRLSTLGLL